MAKASFHFLGTFSYFNNTFKIFTRYGTTHFPDYLIISFDDLSSPENLPFISFLETRL